MGLSSILGKFSNFFRNKREIWLDEATLESTRQDLTQLVVYGESPLWPYFQPENLAAFVAKFGPISETNVIPMEKVLASISATMSHPVDRVSQQLINLITIHAQFPFIGRREPLNAAGFIRATFLLTFKSKGLFGSDDSILLPGGDRLIIRRVWYERDRLRLIFWGLAMGVSMDQATDVSRIDDIIDVLGRTQFRYPIREGIAPLWREQLGGLAAKLDTNLPTVRLADRLDADVVNRWTEFIVGCSRGTVEQQEKCSEAMDLEQFYDLASRIMMLEVLDNVFMKSFVQ